MEGGSAALLESSWKALAMTVFRCYSSQTETIASQRIKMTITNHKTLTVVALSALGFCVAAGAAEITGKVTLKGTPPPERKIEFDATCGKLHSKEVTTRHFVVAGDGGLANVFVYLKEAPAGKTFTPPAETPVLDQVGCIYEPYVMGVMANQKFKVQNSDSLLHNVHATPKVEGNKEFNVGQPVKGSVKETSFAKREVLVRFKCDVHPWMFAYVGVMDHPYFAVTDKDGKFKLPADLPAGKYTLVAYHLKAGEQTQEITVADGDKKEVSFTMEAPAK